VLSSTQPGPEGSGEGLTVRVSRAPFLGAEVTEEGTALGAIRTCCTTCQPTTAKPPSNAAARTRAGKRKEALAVGGKGIQMGSGGVSGLQ
jgi:hypothetical protein